jgi:hypothetical protein
MILPALPPMIIGFVCIFFPRAIQEFALHSRREGSLFYEWIQSNAYVISVRIAGVLLLLVGALIIYTM